MIKQQTITPYLWKKAEKATTYRDSGGFYKYITKIHWQYNKRKI